MKKRVLKIIMFFFIFSLYIHVYPANHPWVDVELKNFSDLLIVYFKYSQKGEHPDYIEQYLKDRYNEAWAVWESKKSNLPACINCVLENFNIQGNMGVSSFFITFLVFLILINNSTNCRVM
jgi:hypothetical protein